MAKKEKKEKKEKKSRKEKRRERKAEQDKWIYYSDGSVSFIVGILIIFCVLDVVFAIYAISYTKRMERESAARVEAAAKPVERSSKGEAWFLQKDGSIIYENTSGQPNVPGQNGTEPPIPGQETESTPADGEAPAEGEAQTGEGTQTGESAQTGEGEQNATAEGEQNAPAQQP